MSSTTFHASPALGQVEVTTIVADLEYEGISPTNPPSPESEALAHDQLLQPEGSDLPIPQAFIPLEQGDVAFQDALDEIMHKADIQMKMLDSIHEAMQRELNEMFDRHDGAQEAVRKLEKMAKERKGTR